MQSGRALDRVNAVQVIYCSHLADGLRSVSSLAAIRSCVLLVKMLSKLLSATAFAAAAQVVSFTVGSTGGNATSPYQYGLMFEDINNSGDGGVYAELIQNRAFQGDKVSNDTSTCIYTH